MDVNPGATEKHIYSYSTFKKDNALDRKEFRLDIRNTGYTNKIEKTIGKQTQIG